ncbi:MAG: hypothetical protein GX345_07570, partial [Clostridiales bacterium]|nr:hypothetical protein [Clostridiales bacterium]
MSDIYFSHKSDTEEVPVVDTYDEDSAPLKPKSPFGKAIKVFFALILILALFFASLTAYIFFLMQKTDYNSGGSKNNVYV